MSGVQAACRPACMTPASGGRLLARVGHKLAANIQQVAPFRGIAGREAAAGVRKGGAPRALPGYSGLRHSGGKRLLNPDLGFAAACQVAASSRAPQSYSTAAGAARAVVAAPERPTLRKASAEAVENYGFTEVQGELIGEYNAHAVLYRHNKTGAEVMSVATDDENKVFGIVFRTPPQNSTGIPHILEHSVLCGSRKYPLKEPFVELMKGSLNTFLNAFTYPDRTCYPVASTNLQDFYNLVDVYLDAVLYPNCVRDEQTFQQEGWHYELDKPEDDITFKGVVFNEMKGVYSQPDSMLARYTQQALFPDNTYGVDSGGDPSVIPDLTFAEFQDFHRKFYHPSNARIWFYGDDPLDKRLEILHNYLSEFERNEAVHESEVGIQPLFPAPKQAVHKYAVGADGSQTKSMVAVNWVLAEDVLDTETELALGFLDNLLLGTPAAPLRKVLMESGLGEAIIGGGMDDDLRQPAFSIGLKGVAAERAGEVEALVLKTLEELAETGFSEEAVEASINTIEFSLRENNTGSFPRGLALMLRSVGKWLYNRSPFEPLRFAAPLEHFKAQLQQQGIQALFGPLIRKYLLDNPHRVTLQLQPDPALGEAVEAEERARLAAAKAALADEQVAALISATQALRERQETPDPPSALATIPALDLGDIPREAATIPSAREQRGGATLLRHELFTNSVLYAEAVLDLRRVPEALLPLVPLFSQALLEGGTQDLDFVQLNQLIGRKTGGISAYPLTSSRRGSSEAVSHFVVKGKGMAGQAGELLGLMRTVLQDVQFADPARFKQWVSQAKARMEARVVGGGHSLAATRIDAKDSSAGWVAEAMGGASYLAFLRQLEQRLDGEWEAVCAQLEEIRGALLSQEGAIINLTADEKTLAAAEGPVSDFLSALPEKGGPRHEWGSLFRAGNEALVVPTQVNYVGKGANLYRAGYQLSGSAYVISKHIGNTWLWDRVRVSGGAYGGFCDFDSHSGMFTYLSYRDPNLVKTLDTYDGTPAFLRSLRLEGDALTKAIIGTIGDIDAYQLPDAKGYTALMRHILNVSDEERQQRREEVLATSEKDFVAFADVLEAVRSEDAHVVAVASAADAAEAAKTRPELKLTIDQLL